MCSHVRFHGSGSTEPLYDFVPLAEARDDWGKLSTCLLGSLRQIGLVFLHQFFDDGLRMGSQRLLPSGTEGCATNLSADRSSLGWTNSSCLPFFTERLMAMTPVAIV